MNIRKILNYVFLLAELILYILIYTSPYVKEVSYLSIIVVFLYALTFMGVKNKSIRFLQLGLFTTLIADYFFVWLGSYKEAAMISFSVTQIAYGFVLLEYSKNKKLEIFIRVIGSFFTIIVTGIVLKNNSDLLSLVSMFYYFNLILNAILSFIESPTILLKIGLVLFICCDTVIGLQGLTEYLPMTPESIIYKIIFIPFNLAWIFYLPSQVLIAYSMNHIANINATNEEKLEFEIVTNA